MAKIMPKTMAGETVIKSAVVLRRVTVIFIHAARVMEIAALADHALVKAGTSAVAQPITMETGIAARRVSDSIITRVRLSTLHKVATKAAAPSHLSLVMDQSAGLKALITAWKDHAARNLAHVAKADFALRAGEKEGRRCHHAVMATRVITII